MLNPSKRQCLAVASGWLLLAGCSSHSGADPIRSVHAQAAQRIELDSANGSLGAVAADVVTSNLEATTPNEEIRLPDGTVGIKVDQRYFHTIVVCRQKDGTFSTQCPVAPGSSP